MLRFVTYVLNSKVIRLQSWRSRHESLELCVGNGEDFWIQERSFRAYFRSELLIRLARSILAVEGATQAQIPLMKAINFQDVFVGLQCAEQGNSGLNSSLNLIQTLQRRIQVGARCHLGFRRSKVVATQVGGQRLPSRRRLRNGYTHHRGEE